MISQATVGFSWIFMDFHRFSLISLEILIIVVISHEIMIKFQSRSAFSLEFH